MRIPRISGRPIRDVGWRLRRERRDVHRDRNLGDFLREVVDTALDLVEGKGVSQHGLSVEEIIDVIGKHTLENISFSQIINWFQMEFLKVVFLHLFPFGNR